MSEGWSTPGSGAGSDEAPAPTTTPRDRRPIPARATGEFEIQEVLGAGGQGVVYKAHQRSTRRLVALKILDGLPREDTRRRFEREVTLAASLRHPGIVTVHASGLDAGEAWCAFEYIHGVPITDFVRTRALGRREIVRLLAGVADALAHAHQRGVIHRDVKPSNILVDGEGRPHVCDFGIARLASRALDERGLPTTMTGDFVGTLRYASPEQVEGDPDAVDTRSDVFSLGVVAYELLTGASPHPSEGGRYESLKALHETSPAPPSQHDRSIGRALDAIILKALAKDPARRYASAAGFRDDLERWLRGEPVDARRDSAVHVIVRTLARHRAVTVLAGLSILAVLAGLASSLRLNERLRAERDRARLEAMKARETSRMLSQALGPFSGRFDAMGSRALSRALDEAGSRIDARRDLDPLVRASLQATLGEALLAAGDAQKAIGRLQQASHLRASLPAGDVARQDGELLLAIATASADARGAEALLRACVESRQSSEPVDALRVAEAEMALARALGAQGRLRECLEVLASAERLVGDGGATWMKGMVDLEHALAQDRLGDASEADRRFASARSSFAQTGLSSATEIRLLLLQARSAAGAGRMARARSLADEAGDRALRTFAGDHPLVAEARELGLTLESPSAASMSPLLEDAWARIRVDF